jgi:hypothetical protein
MLRSSAILALAICCAFGPPHLNAEENPVRVARTVSAIEQALGDPAVDRVFVPAGVYRLGSKSLRMRTGSNLECASPATTVLIYEGTGAAIIFDSISYATLARCQIRMLGKGRAQAIIFQNTTGDNKWNLVRNIFVQGAQLEQGAPLQIGLLFEASTKYALYWNVVDFFVAMNVDVGISMRNAGTFSANGANDNTFMTITAHHCRIGMEISRYATENKVFGLSGSASGYAGENTLLVVGDETHAPADFNMIFGLVSDQGTHGRAWNIYKGVQNTYIQGTDQSGIGSADAGSNSVIERIGGGSSTFAIPELRTNKALASSPVKHVRAAVGCSTRALAAAACTSREMRWNRPFPNAEYTLSCTLSDVSGQPHIIGTHQTSYGFTVTIANDQPVASTGTVNCIAIGDP